MPEERGSPSTSSVALTRQLANAVIAVTVHCRGCGYNIKGLPSDGACPECGLPVAESIQAIVDPQASRLPSLSSPRRVGNALFWVVTCGLLIALFLLGQPVLRWLPAGPGRGWAKWPLTLPTDLSLLAAGAALAALWAVFLLKPPRGKETGPAVARHLGLVAGGLIALILLTSIRWLEERTSSAPSAGSTIDPSRLRIDLALGAASAAVLLGLGGVLKTIGRRSLAYRRSHAARQSVHTMLAALAGIAVGELVRWLAAAQQSNVWMVRGTILFSASGLMIIIGLLYMVGNAWWIRADLRRPPPVLDQLLLPNLPRDTRVPGVEDDGDEGKENAELP